MEGPCAMIFTLLSL